MSSQPSSFTQLDDCVECELAHHACSQERFKLKRKSELVPSVTISVTPLELKQLNTKPDTPETASLLLDGHELLSFYRERGKTILANMKINGIFSYPYPLKLSRQISP